MPKIKVYAPPMRETFLHREWLAALGYEGSHSQGEMLIAALSKPDVVGLLEDRGMGGYSAAALGRAARMIRSDLATPWQMLVDAGVADLTRPSVWIARDMVRDSIVAEVMPDGTARPACRIGYDSRFNGRGLFVEEVFAS